MGQPRPLFVYFRSFQTQILQKNCWLQRDLSLDCWSRRRAGWPLDHHHGPVWLMSLELHALKYYLFIQYMKLFCIGIVKSTCSVYDQVWEPIKSWATQLMKWSARLELKWLMNSVTRSVDFWKFLATNLLTKVTSQKIGDFWANLKKINLYKNYLGNFWIHWATLLLQHLVKLSMNFYL